MKLSKDKKLIGHLVEVNGYLSESVLQELLSHVDKHLEENNYHVYKHKVVLAEPVREGREL